MTTAAEGVTAWTGPTDARLIDALEPAHAWVRAWRNAVEDAVARASTTLPAPGATVNDGSSALSIAQVVCDDDATALRAQISS